MTAVGAGYYIGLMSGTSLDGVDGVLVEFPTDSNSLRLLGHQHRPFSPDLRSELLALNTRGEDEVHRTALAANSLAHSYHTVVSALLQAEPELSRRVRAIGAHGQTIRHRPLEFDGVGYTVQLMNGSLLAELTGIDVVCDFRSRDVAAGGQGAPLVPGFHQACFYDAAKDTAVVNIGGIANISLLYADGRITGLDCGPGNVLMDLWIQQHRGQPYDEAGAWAASGKVCISLLQAMVRDPFFHRPPPKSTGRDQFHRVWLERCLSDCKLAPNQKALPVVDIQTTLCELTASTVQMAILQQMPNCEQVVVCGGGALNVHLMGRLSALLAPCAVKDTASFLGMNPMHIEAEAFAWLAKAFIERQPANCPAVTGSIGNRILGALYPA